MSCFMKVPYLLYRFKPMAFPKSKPIHNLFTNCAPFPSISNPCPFPYGFPLQWRALVLGTVWSTCPGTSRGRVTLKLKTKNFKGDIVHSVVLTIEQLTKNNDFYRRYSVVQTIYFCNTVQNQVKSMYNHRIAQNHVKSIMIMIDWLRITGLDWSSVWVRINDLQWTPPWPSPS